MIATLERYGAGAHIRTDTETFGTRRLALVGDVVTSPTMPLLIPADQAYYWSVPWQESERRALEDIAGGRTRAFSDPKDAVRYLLGESE